MNAVLRYIRKLVVLEGSREVGDGELLRRFVERRDEAAFAALVDRHGPLVLRACRRILPSEQDAEDVLQATFLVFVRQAHSIRQGGSVGSWLYGVAYRLALKLRAQAARRRAHEQAVETARPPGQDPLTLEEARLAVEEELDRLPEKYRAPILLCCLEGKSRDEAARELGWAAGAIKIRLERGRELLRTRLARRGLTLSAALVATLLGDTARAALPVRLAAIVVEAGMQLALGSAPEAASAPATALADAMLRSLALTRAKTIAALLLIMAVIGLGTAAALRLVSAPAPPIASLAEQAPRPVPAPPKQEEQRGGRTATGNFRPGRAARGTITVRVKERDTVYTLAPDVAVTIDGKDAHLADLKHPCRVTVTLSPDETQVVRVVAEGTVVPCRVVSVDAREHTLTVWWRADSLSRRTFPVTPDATITVGGKTATLADLHEEGEVSVTLSVDGRSVVAVVGRVKD